MSNDNNQDPPQNTPSEPVITFEVFETFHKANPDLDNSEYYKAFPTVKTGTVRSWKSKARSTTIEPTPPVQPTDKDEVLKIKEQFLETLIARADVRTKALIDKLDIDSKILVLQENEKQQKPLPNTPSIPTPTGMPKVGLAKYMKYVPGSEKISWEIPASVLLDPKKNKKLGEYQ